MKRFLTALLATMLVASMLTACGNKEEKETPTVESKTETVTSGKESKSEAKESTSETKEEVAESNSEDAELESYVETLGIPSDNSNAFGIDFSDEAIAAPTGEDSNYDEVIRHAIKEGYYSNMKKVFFASNYASTADMLRAVNSENNADYDMLYRDDDTSEDVIANAIDAIAAEEGTSVYLVAIETVDTHPVVIYMENGNAYGINGICVSENNYIKFSWSFYSGNEGTAYKVNIDSDGNIESIEQ